ncbi:MAG: hypothetical protein CYG59_01750 [Chloroflexi bacterium]|nr:MAG: hypothetical protein CYG59_01750 [Chloroflexota bacterium]
MLNLPPSIITIFAAFAPLFTHRVFRHAQVLLAGTILTPGRRTITNALRVMGLQHSRRFQNYHRVLNRACWSSRKAAQIVLDLLVASFARDGVVVLGLDETLERRQGDKIAAKGIYRDAARSSKTFFVKASGLRWISLMVLAPIPWAGRVWALPFLTVLAPSERYAAERGKRHKKLTDWARQMVIQVRRWLPDRPLVLVADSGYAVLVLLHRCTRFTRPVTMSTRLRLDAALYAPAPVRQSKQKGRPRLKGKRLPTLQHLLDDPSTEWATVTVERWYSQGPRDIEIVSAQCVWYHSGMPVVPIRWVLIRDPRGNFAPQALVCTDIDADPVQIVSWFVLRWQLETTFQAVRTHLGVETQRQWNDLAIVRTTPALLGLFSLVTLCAHEQASTDGISIRQAAWYSKQQPTFADALAAVRRQMWASTVSCTSRVHSDMEKLQHSMLEQLTETLCYTA